MKRFLNWLLLACMLAALLPTGVLAADSTTKPDVAGMYGITGSATLTPKTETGTDITATTEGSYESYYPGAVRFDVTLTGLTANAQYLLLVVQGEKGTGTAVPTADNIVYIDQTADSGGSITFNAYPSRLTTGHYCVYVVGSDRTYSAGNPDAQFDYYLPYTLGDVNDNGKIQANDAMLVLRHVAKLVTLDETAQLAADVNGNGKIQANDAMLILRYVAKLITEF